MYRITLATAIGMAAFSAQAQTPVVIDTNLGKIELVLDEQKAPQTGFVKHCWRWRRGPGSERAGV